MNLVWNLDGVSVASVSMNRWDGQQMWTSGMCWKNDVDSRGVLQDVRAVYQWEATVTPSGWYVVITAAHGKLGEVQGVTFNLPLEIQHAVKVLA